MNAPKFFTTGCRGKQSEDLPLLLDAREAVLADVRLSAAAGIVGNNEDDEDEFTPRRLERLLGGRYRRVAQLGNRSLKAGEFHILHLALGLRIIRSWQINVVLMCDCEAINECHRSVISRELERQNLAVEEISVWHTGHPLPPLLFHASPDLRAANKTRKNGMESVAEIALRSELIVIKCGTDESVSLREVAALVAGGLAIHEDASQLQCQVITHQASGRSICALQSAAQAQFVLAELLKLNVDWTREVPWQTEKEAVKLKEQIRRLTAKLQTD